MPKEPGEEFSEDSPEWPTEKEEAETALEFFSSVLDDVESGKGVDLDKLSNAPAPFSKVPSLHLEGGKQQIRFKTVSREEALRTELQDIKKRLDYLDPEQRHLADGLIMKAELYLAAHDPKKKK